MQVLPDASADSLDAFVTASVDVGSRVITDDWQATRAFPRSDTLPTIGEASAPRACEEVRGELLPLVHRASQGTRSEEPNRGGHVA